MTVEYPTLPPGVQIKPIPGHPGYYASSDGRLWSCRRRRIGGFSSTMAPLKATPSKKTGYLGLTLASDRKSHRVHRLILETFVGPCPPGMEACHDPDPDPANCRLENLRWDTRQANRDDMTREGRGVIGTKNGRAVLDEDKVQEIRRLARTGVSQRGLARRFGVNRVSIKYILVGRNWKHLPGPPPMASRQQMTEYQAATIIRMGRLGMKQKQIASEIGTTQTNVSLILLGKSWRGLHINNKWKDVLGLSHGQ